MGLPLVSQQAGVGVDIGVLGWVDRAGVIGAVLDVGAGVVLGPEAVEDEACVLSALACVRMGVAELWRPGEVEQVEVEGLVGGGWLHVRRRGRRWLRLGVATDEEGQGEKKNSLHAGAG